MQWKDTTGYSRDKPRIATSWSVYLADELKITVTCGHIYHPGEWVVHCEPWFNTRPLGKDVVHASQAQEKALELVREKVAKIAAALAVQ